MLRLVPSELAYEALTGILFLFSFLIAKKDENASFLAYPIINDPPSPEEEVSHLKQKSIRRRFTVNGKNMPVNFLDRCYTVD